MALVMSYEVDQFGLENVSLKILFIKILIMN